MSKLKKFLLVFEKFLYLSQSVIAGVLQLSGDVIAQKFIEKKPSLDRTRSISFFALGCFTGIVLRKWYGILDHKIKDPRRLKLALKKVAGGGLRI